MKSGWVALACVTAVALPGAAVAATISGQVLDEHGAPVAGVDLDFVVVATGQPESANMDTTDAAGNYATTVSDKVFDVYYTPPPGSRLAGYLEPNVNLTVNQTVNVVLADAWIVSGSVRRADDSGPAVGVDLDFVDKLTGQKLFTPGDDTDLAGNYSVAVPRGIYDVFFDGPEPVLPSDPPQLAPAVIDEISVGAIGDVSLAEVVMEPGFHVSGEVLDSKGDGVVNADLDFLVPGTSLKVFSKTDNTDARGRFDTLMPAGDYDVQFNPPAGAPLAAKIVPAIAVAADVSLGTTVLDDGLRVSGRVLDLDGRAKHKVDLDFRPGGGGAAIPTAWDETASDGSYSVYVPAGSYDIRYLPLVDSLVDETTTPVGVGSDVTLPDTLLPYHDEDADGVPDVDDLCPFRSDAAQGDLDGDGVGDACDRCPGAFDPRQEDNDDDGAGDACDGDDDNDGVADTLDDDDDGDGVLDTVDNCPGARNPDQRNGDGDPDGDACDPDDGEVERIEAVTGTGFRVRPETGASGYAVYRQRLSRLSEINYGEAVQFGVAAPSFRVVADPAAQEGWSLLVTAKIAGVEGSLGRRSDGAERPNLRPCP